MGQRSTATDVDYLSWDEDDDEEEEEDAGEEDGEY